MAVVNNIDLGVDAYNPGPIAIYQNAPVEPWGLSRSGNESPGFIAIPQLAKFLAEHTNALAAWIIKVETDAHLIDPKEQLSYITKAGDFSVSQMAQLLGVSRPTIYSWRKGAVIQGENIEKINRLYQELEAKGSYELGQLSRLANFKLQSGSTVIQALQVFVHAGGSCSEVFSELEPLMQDWSERQGKANSLHGSDKLLLTKSHLQPSIKSIG